MEEDISMRAESMESDNAQAGTEQQENYNNIKTQMRKGILEYCILLLLRHRELYATEIIEALREADLIVVEGALYPLINRMRKWEMIRYRNVYSSVGPPRKYYQLTEAGEVFLKQLEYNWNALEDSVNKLKELSPLADEGTNVSTNDNH